MIEIITDRDALAELKAEWDELANRFGSPLLEYDWFMSCLETINRNNQIKIVLVKSNKKIKLWLTILQRKNGAIRLARSLLFSELVSLGQV